jgi:hypothetical protein
VDKPRKPIEPSIMHGTGFPARSLARPLALLAGAMLAACSSSTPPPEKPAPEYTQEESWGPGKREPESQPEADPVAPGVKPSTAVATPDDYEMTNRDCVELGRQLKAVIRNDEVVKLSPKLKQNQRDAAEASIDRAATTRQDQWIEGCQSSLVGKVVNQAALKCAMGTKTVKDFDACLNTAGDEPAK